MKHSEEWSISKELAKSNHRMFIALIVVISLWFMTIAGLIAGFVWYLNQYDFSSETVEITADQDGKGTNIVGGGNVDYGAESQN